MSEAKPRTVEAPAKERLDGSEAAIWCGIDGKDWADMVRFGIIPEGAKRSRQSQWWRWEVVMGVNALLEHLMAKLLRCRRKEYREAAKARRENRKVPQTGKKSKEPGTN